MVYVDKAAAIISRAPEMGTSKDKDIRFAGPEHGFVTKTSAVTASADHVCARDWTTGEWVQVNITFQICDFKRGFFPQKTYTNINNPPTLILTLIILMNEIN